MIDFPQTLKELVEMVEHAEQVHKKAKEDTSAAEENERKAYDRLHALRCSVQFLSQVLVNLNDASQEQ